MKRTALKRKTPLRRKSKPTKRAPRRVGKRGPARDEKYLARVRELKCPMWWLGCCSYPTEAHHAGPRPGVGIKCSDYKTHPFCRVHHRDWHSSTGWFYGWTRTARRSWADEQVLSTQRALGYVGDPTRAGTSKEDP